MKIDFHGNGFCENGFSPFKKMVVKMGFHRIYGCENGFSQEWIL